MLRLALIVIGLIVAIILFFKIVGFLLHLLLILGFIALLVAIVGFFVFRFKLRRFLRRGHSGE